MGTILHTSTKKSVVLAAYSVLGRAPTNLVQLTEQAASMVHAAISWSGERWELRDLNSTNGTWVNGERVPLKEQVALSHGSRLRFGPDGEQWELIDDCGPVVVARCLTTGETKAAENGLLELPDEVDAHVSVFADVDGQWIVEMKDGARHSATNEESISIGDRTWELVVPPQSPYVGTYKAKSPPSLSTISLRFRVSHDKKHVNVDILNGDDTIPLGERALFGVLLALARKRIEDETAAKLPESERGWYDLPDLVYDLKAADEQIVNTTSHRLRKLFVHTGVEGGWDIIEKRLKQRRITIPRLQIV